MHDKESNSQTTNAIITQTPTLRNSILCFRFCFFFLFTLRWRCFEFETLKILLRQRRYDWDMLLLPKAHHYSRFLDPPPRFWSRQLWFRMFFAKIDKSHRADVHLHQNPRQDRRNHSVSRFGGSLTICCYTESKKLFILLQQSNSQLFFCCILALSIRWGPLKIQTTVARKILLIFLENSVLYCYK